MTRSCSIFLLALGLLSLAPAAYATTPAALPHAIHPARPTLTPDGPPRPAPRPASMPPAREESVYTFTPRGHLTPKLALVRDIELLAGLERRGQLGLSAAQREALGRTLRPLLTAATLPAADVPGLSSALLAPLMSWIGATTVHSA